MLHRLGHELRDSQRALGADAPDDEVGELGTDHCGSGRRRRLAARAPDQPHTGDQHGYGQQLAHGEFHDGSSGRGRSAQRSCQSHESQVILSL